MSLNISFRKDRNRWEVDYTLDGKRKRPLFREKREAEIFARKINLGLRPEDKDSITVDEGGKKYYAAESMTKSPKSRSNDKRYINLHYHYMTYELGIERLSSVALGDMEGFRDWLLTLTEEPWDTPDPRDSDKFLPKKPMKMGPSTVNRCLRVMKHFYKRHVQWNNIPKTPCLYLEFLETEENERRGMTSEEALQAMDKAEGFFKPVMAFSFLTGFPASCMARMQWSDVSFEHRRYYMIRKKGKKAKLKRTPMTMTEPVFGLLLKVRNEWPLAEGAVFRDGQGRPLLADRITRLANEAIRVAGLKDVTMYCMRHALASDMTEANVATEIVRQAMGHASIATTQRYANKLRDATVSGAIEGVRGGKLVAELENRLRQGNGGKRD